MKRIVFAMLAVLLTVGIAQAGFWGRRGGCCNNRPARSMCETSCAPSCEPVCPPAPTCCKTIEVPTTVMVKKEITVPARKIVTPVPDVIEYVEQPCLEIRTPQPPIVCPQPDIITYKAQPCVIKRHPQAPCIRWECPRDCETR